MPAGIRPRPQPMTAGGAVAGARALADRDAAPLLRRHDDTAASAAPAIDEDVDTGTDIDPDAPWDVIVWDDPVNLMSYVVWVLRRVFSYPEPVARKLMLEVHHRGKALVASEPREQAEMYLQQLHGYGLQATIQRGS